ncbi:MAG: hypothetical protein R6V03_05545 [Kiritimatiellia bacterium]
MDPKSLPLPPGLNAVSCVRVFKGRRFNADLFRLELGPERRAVLLKTFHTKGFLARNVVGRFLEHREYRILKLLADVPDICRIALPHRNPGLFLEWIEGDRLDSFGPDSLPLAVMDELSETVRAMHSAGIAHLDLGHRGNIMVTSDRHPVLLDFQSAVSTRFLPPALKRALHAIDKLAVLKWKTRLAPSSISPEEKLRLQRRQRMSAAWPFHHWLFHPRAGKPPPESD